jgi:hypothetical protein
MEYYLVGEIETMFMYMSGKKHFGLIELFPHTADNWFPATSDKRTDDTTMDRILSAELELIRAHSLAFQ